MRLPVVNQFWLVFRRVLHRIPIIHNFFPKPKKHVSLLTMVAVGIFLFGWFVYFTCVWHRMIYTNASGVWVGWVSIWGDWAMHFTQGSAMAYRSLILTKHPLLINSPFAYPFVVNFLSAGLVRLGMQFFQAFVIPSYLFCLFAVVILLIFYKKLWSSYWLAMASTMVFLCNGGLGFVSYIQQFFQQGMNIQALEITKEYTHLTDQGLQWISVVTSMFIPQRSFVFGFPLAVLLLVLIYREMELEYKKWKRLHFFLLGILYSALPIIHTHAFVMVTLILCFWGVYVCFNHQINAQYWKVLWKKLSYWLLFLLPACVLVPVLLATFFNTTVASTTHGTFIRWYPGWYTHKGAEHQNMSFIQFWWMNWGVTLPLGLIGWLLQPTKKKILLFPFLFIFVLLNLFLFQPFIWDNTKLLVWASLGISGLAVFPLAVLWKKFPYTIPFMAFLFLVCIASGFLDLGYLLNKPRHTYQMYSREDLLLVEYVKTRTSPAAIFLTSDRHNHPLTNLAGRQVLMGFRGWLWTYGLNYAPVERDVMSIYRANSQTPQLLEKYHVNYVVFDSTIRKEWGGKESYFQERYPIVYVTPEYTVYQVKME